MRNWQRHLLFGVVVVTGILIVVLLITWIAKPFLNKEKDVPGEQTTIEEISCDAVNCTACKECGCCNNTCDQVKNKVDECLDCSNVRCDACIRCNCCKCPEKKVEVIKKNPPKKTVTPPKQQPAPQKETVVEKTIEKIIVQPPIVIQSPPCTTCNTGNQIDYSNPGIGSLPANTTSGSTNNSNNNVCINCNSSSETIDHSSPGIGPLPPS